MLKSVVRLGKYEVAHDDALTSLYRPLQPPPGRCGLRLRETDEQTDDHGSIKTDRDRSTPG